MKEFLLTLARSNTVRLAVWTILGALAAYLTGQLDGGAAAVLAITGLLQLLQRGAKLKKEGT